MSDVRLKITNVLTRTDPSIMLSQLELSNDTGIWRETVMLADVPIAIQFIRAGIEMAGGKLIRVEDAVAEKSSPGSPWR